MKITILAVGTRGDVQPYVALAKGLKAAGYGVRVGAPINFESFVTAHGLEYAPLRGDYYQLMDSPEGQALKSGNPLRVMQHMKTTVYPLMRRLMDDSWPAVQGSDAIIFHPKLMIGAQLAEKLNVPAIIAATLPMVATRAFPMPGLVNRDLGGVLNKASYATLNMITRPFTGIIQRWRQEVLGLPAQAGTISVFKLHDRPLPVLHCYSQQVITRPDDWPDHAYVTGYWWLDETNNWQPPADLEAFLANGTPPVYVGFGSMIAEDPASVTRIVIEALQQSGQRGVIASGWGGIRPADLPPSIYLLKEAPHDWLFPRMSAVVHHGGAGTTAAGLRAGKPTVICPFIADQPFWGNRVAVLGAGPKPIPQKKLNVDDLAAAIRAATTDQTMRMKAEALGAKLRAEDGVAQAAQIIGDLFGQQPSIQRAAHTVVSP